MPLRASLTAQNETLDPFSARRGGRRRAPDLAWPDPERFPLNLDRRRRVRERLEQLLNVVAWREALARACAERLEGDWIQAYVAPRLPGGSGLWP